MKQLNFADGRNELEVWMEDEEHHQIENSESRKEFWIDSVRPVIGLEVSRRSRYLAQRGSRGSGRSF